MPKFSFDLPLDVVFALIRNPVEFERRLGEYVDARGDMIEAKRAADEARTAAEDAKIALEDAKSEVDELRRAFLAEKVQHADEIQRRHEVLTTREIGISDRERDLEEDLKAFQVKSAEVAEYYQRLQARSDELDQKEALLEGQRRDLEKDRIKLEQSRGAHSASVAEFRRVLGMAELPPEE